MVSFLSFGVSHPDREEAPLGPGVSTRGGVACCYTRAPGKPGVVVSA
jgi:hypothetical protein